ncbi:MAG: putative protein YcgM [Candidatus Celerinatantimonas neptuna]|nr:MAG: putative protein YcgM [Candidatus Celerinatantimonas neptuna]
MTYQHRDVLGNVLDYSLGKIVCVGQNYADHIKEMNSPSSDQAVFFIKPSTAACSLSPVFSIPTHQGECHHELELAVLIGERLKNASVEQAQNAIIATTLALDLTLRNLQAQLKSKGHPWERAKGFDGSAPIGPWLNYQGENLQDLNLQLSINGKLVQSGSTTHMLRGCVELLSQASHCFTLEPGDILLTGTPSGVGPLHVGDHLVLGLNDALVIESEVKASV